MNFIVKIERKDVTKLFSLFIIHFLSCVIFPCCLGAQNVGIFAKFNKSAICKGKDDPYLLVPIEIICSPPMK